MPVPLPVPLMTLALPGKPFDVPNPFGTFVPGLGPKEDSSVKVSAAAMEDKRASALGRGAISGPWGELS